MLLVDDGGRILFATGAAERLLGRPPRDLEGLPLSDLLHPEERAALLRAAGRLRFACASGDWRVLDVAADDRLDDPAVRGLVLVLREPGAAPDGRHAPTLDFLTGLPDRRAFTERLGDLLAELPTLPAGAGILLADLDDFRGLNDAHGVAAGDAVLRAVAARLAALVVADERAEATPRLAFAARVAGDAFGLVIEGADAQGMEDFARALATRLAEPVTTGGTALVPRLSLGGVVATPAHLSAGGLLGEAETALEAAKAAMPGAAIIWSEDLVADRRSYRVVTSELAGAVERGELLLHYQPIVSLDDGTPVGVEALLRWQHPARGLVMPGGFLAEAEQSGLIVPIGNWVIGEALRQLVEWRNIYGRDLAGFVSVNVSGLQFDHPGLLVETIAEARRALLPLDRLKIEITETAMVRNPDELRLILAQLCEQGATIAIDDFGIGYSSISGLGLWSFDTIKIDRSFVSDAGTERGAEVLKTLLHLARTFQANIVAEGVETEDQAAFLRRHGCRLAQGYLYGRPMDPASCGAYLLRSAG